MLVFLKYFLTNNIPKRLNFIYLFIFNLSFSNDLISGFKYKYVYLYFFFCYYIFECSKSGVVNRFIPTAHFRIFVACKIFLPSTDSQ